MGGGRAEPPEPIYFESPEQLRDWFDANHETATELWLGYWKKARRPADGDWAQAVDEALCVGWIDTTRYSVDEERSRQRFTPRRKGSNWSAVNVANVERLDEGGPDAAGRDPRRSRRRTEARTAVYSYEQRREARLTDEEEARFRANEAAWAWFQGRPRRTGRRHWWIVNAKRPETRERRLASLIEESAKGLMPSRLTPPGKRPDGSASR